MVAFRTASTLQSFEKAIYFLDLSFEKTKINGGKNKINPYHPNDRQMGINNKEIPERMVKMDFFFKP